MDGACLHLPGVTSPHRGRISVLLAGIFSAILGHAQPVDPEPDVTRGWPRPMRIWSREEYGAGPVVLSIARQPKTGFIYLGSGPGVSEYDGVRWIFVDAPDRAPIRGAAIDHVGRVWSGSYNGVFMMRPNAAGELVLRGEPEPLPPELREIGYVKQIESTPLGVSVTARQDIILLPTTGPVRSWHAEVPVNNVWWMEDALHVSVPEQGTFRLDDGGRLTRLHAEAPVVWAARTETADRTLLITAHGPLWWTGTPRRFERPPGYGNFFAAQKPEVSAAVFLRDGRSASILENGDLGIFDPEGNSVLVWRRLPTLEFNLCRQMIEDDEGGLWLAKHAGVIRIQLDPVPASAPPLRAMIRRVLNPAGQVLYSASAGNPLPTPLTLARDANALRVEFAAPSFRHERQGGAAMQFRSRLAGVDTEWTSWSPIASRDFSALPFREFTLQVEARRPGETEAAGASLAFRLHRVWWRTPWAIGLTIAGGGVALFGAHRLGTRALRRRAGRLEALVAARTAELEVKNARLAAQNEELNRLHQLDLDEKAAVKLAEEKARLEMLRYQLNPHFLYNALNSIYGLVLTTPRAAADMVLRLSEFCRATLTRHETELVTVEACFARLQLYLAIEKVRWKDSLQVDLDLEEAARGKWIPPFLLQPLVENAIKYGGSTSPGDLRVRLTGRIESTGALRLEVANTGEWIDPAVARARGNTGLGHANMLQRLERAYPGAYEFTTDTKNGWVVVRLRLTQRIEDGGQKKEQAVSSVGNS